MNNVRVDEVSEINIALIISRSCAINNPSLPVEVIYLFAENSLKVSFNNERLMKLNYPLTSKVLSLLKISQAFVSRSLLQLRIAVKL